MTTVQELVDQLYAVSAEREIDPATRLALNTTECRLREGRYAEVDELLSLLDPTKLQPGMILAILMLTRFERERMPSRVAFLASSETSLVERLGAERATLLIDCRR